MEIKKTYPIKGMHCASCVSLIEKSLKKTPGVADAVANLATEKATVTYDPNVCSDQQIAKAVSNVGYAVSEEHEEISEDQEKMEKINQKEENREPRGTGKR